MGEANIETTAKADVAAQMRMDAEHGNRYRVIKGMATVLSDDLNFWADHVERLEARLYASESEVLRLQAELALKGHYNDPSDGDTL